MSQHLRLTIETLERSLGITEAEIERAAERMENLNAQRKTLWERQGALDRNRQALVGAIQAIKSELESERLRE